MAEDIDKLVRIDRPYRCDTTGNPVGTDTIKVGRQCPCQGCRADREIQSLRSRVSELEAERDAAVLAEREAIAKWHDKMAAHYLDLADTNGAFEHRYRWHEHCKSADAIRARSNTNTGPQAQVRSETSVPVAPDGWQLVPKEPSWEILIDHGIDSDTWAALLAASPSPPAAVDGGAFQARVQPWMMACFGAEISADRLERSDRFVEEALELVQAGGYSKERAHQLVEYVFNRDVGEVVQEAGGVMVTLAAYCLAYGVDMHEAGERELARVWTKVEAIRAKQAAKPKGSALPVPTPVSEAVGGGDVYVAANIASLERMLADGGTEDVITAESIKQQIKKLQRERGAVAGRDGLGGNCALKGTGPAATLSESEKVPTASDDLVTEIAEHIPLRLHVGEGVDASSPTGSGEVPSE